MIEKSNIAGFGDLKEGANVVDYSVRKAWESYFHLDFDYTYKPSSRTYIPGLSRVRAIKEKVFGVYLSRASKSIPYQSFCVPKSD
jgi:hypothetical protein